MIPEGESFDPHDSPGSAPAVIGVIFCESIIILHPYWSINTIIIVGNAQNIIRSSA